MLDEWRLTQIRLEATSLAQVLSNESLQTLLKGTEQGYKAFVAGDEKTELGIVLAACQQEVRRRQAEQ
jgi:hypothetical protein